MADQHNRLGLTPHIEPKIDWFDVGINDAIRPYRVINAGEFVRGCKAAIEDSALRELVPVGTFDQLTHSDDALVNFTEWPRHVAQVHQRLLS